VLINCYSSKGHSYLGNLLKEYTLIFEPKIYNLLSRLYPDIKKDSVWADTIKNQNEFIWTKKLHYIDIEECPFVYTPDIFLKYCQEGCITSAIEYFVKQSVYDIKSGMFNSKSHKFLLHFLQDLSQPYHLYGKFRGGNDYRIKLIINGFIRNTNLHFLYDSLLMDFYIKTEVFSLENIEYEKNIKNSLYTIAAENAKTGCVVFPEEQVVIFENYYNKEVINTLIRNYLKVSLSVYNHILENTSFIFDIQN
jgi:hypothetical protein